jgi:ATP-dependent helicase HepA
VEDFIPGQRWISDAELHLGLGSIGAVDQRTVTVDFLATGETRTYARQTAPLTRVRFAPGDIIRNIDGETLHIETVHEQAGRLVYDARRDDGTHVRLDESQLDPTLQLNRPAERLFSAQLDTNKWFELRSMTQQQRNRLGHSDLYGLLGGRTSLIPHQLYIAHEVATRYAPRVLLADEVGLGKTIEAGLILHYQLLTGRAARVLIVVPESLQHQWLVEMLRRFNLRFSIFDAERCTAMCDADPDSNPFHAEQLVLCSLEFLRSHSEYYKQAFLGQWDLLVVDEAHHLEWSPQQASLEYELIALLAGETSGVLLLTATPEQLGKQGHFARLRLLDPDRFPDYDSFIAEEHNYAPIADAVEALIKHAPLTDSMRHTLLGPLREQDQQHLLELLDDPASGATDKEQARHDLIEHLLDRHGTGRVLFRNTRAAVKGFPPREVQLYPLPLPAAYNNATCRSSLSPERRYNQPDWPEIDPRVDWLIAHLRSLRGNKVLVIASQADTVLELAAALRTRAGLHAAIFHEGLSLIERDRAAAWFADPEYGSPVLLCSEIGSEGRNFQFAHHLVMFDLPLNPDLLEQRIGRLDRIGQTHTIRIHVPCLEGSAQQVMARWYDEGLSAFAHPCPAGYNVYQQLEGSLLQALQQPELPFEELLEGTRQQHELLNAALQNGRDRLLEYNSCRPAIADKLQQRAQAEDADPALGDFLDNAFDCFGIDTELHSANSLVLTPTDTMQEGCFPGLSEEGMTVTRDRDTALANEDMQFLSWEHPSVRGLMEILTSSELGNSALCSAKLPGIRAGALLAECLFLLEPAAYGELHATRYLPPTLVRIIVDGQGNDLGSLVPAENVVQSREDVDGETAATIVKTYRGALHKMIDAAEQLASQQATAILEQAHQRAAHTLSSEIERLQALRQHNPNVRADEIDWFVAQREAIDTLINKLAPRLDAVRVIVTT